jgi:hypothetical protein
MRKGPSPAFPFAVVVTTRNGYTSCRGLPVLGSSDAYPCLPAASFRVRRYEHGRLATGKGNGAGRWSLVKYNQPQGSPMLELEELKLSFSVGG